MDSPTQPPAAADPTAQRPPDPGGAATPVDFVRELRLLKIWAGDPSYDDLRRRTGLPRSTVAAAFSPSRERLPPLDLVRRLVGVLGRPGDAPAWEEAWTRLRVTETADPADQPTGTTTVPSTSAAAASARWRGPRPAVQDLVGRSADSGDLLDLLSERQLVTLVGPGGVGKTTLALEVAAVLFERAAGPGGPDPDQPAADGVAVADLTAAADDEAIVQVVGALFGLRAPDPIDLLDSVVTVLSGRRTLLVLDNCEHVVDGCRRLLGRLLPACPVLTVLATSRQVLGVPNERVRQLDPLDLPPDVGPVDPATPAVALFLRRAAEAAPARAVDGTRRADLAATARVCRRLDGLPLALELAAARLRTVDVAELADRLDVDLGLLRVGRPGEDGRHTTLAAVVDWSYRLLDPVEQRLLDRLSVFRGGFRLAAAEAVCAGGAVPATEVLPTLVRLVDRSLVQAYEANGALRYRLLEAVREHAATRLAEIGETELVQRRHLDVVFAWLTETYALPRFDDRVAVWRDAAAEVDNVRAALAAGFATRPLLTVEATLLALDMWITLLRVAECKRWLAVVERYRAELPVRLRCLLDARQGLMRASNQDQVGAAVLYTGALDALREHWPRDYHEAWASSLFYRTCAVDAGVLATVPTAVAVAEAAPDPEWAAQVFSGAVVTLLVWGRVVEAADAYRKLMAVPADSARVLTYQAALGLLLAPDDDPARAAAATRRLSAVQDTALLHPEWAIWARALYALARGDPAAVRALVRAAQADLTGVLPTAIYRGHAGLISLAEAERRLGDLRGAREHLDAALQDAGGSTDYMIETAAVLAAALLAASLGAAEVAADLAARWDAQRRAAGLPVPIGFAAEAERVLGLDPAPSAVAADYRWDADALRKLVDRARRWSESADGRGRPEPNGK